MAKSDSPGGGRSPLLFIFLTVFIDLLGFGIVLPMLPIYSRVFDASAVTLSWLFASFSGMQFLFAPLWGRLSDRVGRRPVLIGGLLGTSASYALFASADSLTMLFAARLLAGVFGATISTASAYIADVTTPENRARGMGLIGAAFGLGFTLGPWLGGELTSISQRLPGLIACGLSLSAAAFGWFKLPEPPRGKRSDSRLFRIDQLRHALSDRRLGTLLLLGFLALSAFAAFETMLLLFGLAEFPQRFGLETAVRHATREQLFDAAKYAGRYLGVVGLISALIQGVFIRRLVPRFGETKLIVAGPLFLGLGFAIVGLATSWTLVVVGCIVMPFGFGLNNPSLSGLLSRASPADEQGAYLGMNQSFASLARLASPPLAGLLFDHVSTRGPFLAGAGILALATLLAAWYRTRYGATFQLESRAGT